ncbi:hypothetical protein F442_01992 [Phytophthora nicotianae P10297]|uniref:Uncharacterized protein n=1 Tax=Phytophthora nicotianae P10297 TaxID=1317064 RepID=W3A3G9_PHYNI|nr:hypothetical protein F442_01992 [Phytophthora nicotianae P10297]
MAALRPDTEDPRDDTGASWALPNWEEYSEVASSSFAGDWSDVEADVSLDTASSVASTEHQRVYRIQRSRGGFQEEKQRDLSELHTLYTRRRLDESFQGLSSVRSSANWFQPAPCVSPRVPEEKPLSPVAKQKEKQVENELLAQQSEISAELQAVRRQLNDFQDKWKKSVEAKAGESSEASTVQSSWPSPISVRHVRTGFQETAVQTENDEREHAVTQWLLLLTQKLETLTRKYSHEPTQSFQASMTYLAGVWGPNNDSNGLLKETKETNNGSGEADEGPALSSWHVGRDLKAAVPLEVAEQFLELEHSIASLNTAVEQHERRQMTNFDRAIQQVQGFHQERIQKVVDESLAELKLVRGRYKKKEAQLEDELRAANKDIEQWKLTAAEAEHRKKLDRESLEFQLTAAKEQHDHICRRYEGDIVRLKTQLEVVRAERKQVLSQHRDTHEVIAQAKEGAVALERQCQALKKQQERAKELHDREIRVLQDSVRQLREGKDDMELRHAKEKQALIETIQKLEAQQTDTQEARIRGEIEQQIIPERLASLENQHQETVSAMESEHKRQLAELAARLDETKRSAPSTVRSIETQTDSLPVEKSTRKNYKVEASDAQAQIEGLTRRCQALEKLLDKKFEETSYSSQRCESCHSDDGISVSSVLERHDLNASRSSIHSGSFRPRVSGKSRALARALLGSSRASMNSVSSDSKASPFMNETTLATDEATLGAHEMWDSASFTSIDTVDDLSSQRTTPRQRMRSTQEILTLVRQIKQAAASPLDRREPDPEVNWGTPKQKSTMSRGFNSKGAGKSAAPNSSHSTGEDTSVTPGTSIFDDLLC